MILPCTSSLALSYNYKLYNNDHVTKMVLNFHFVTTFVKKYKFLHEHLSTNYNTVLQKCQRLNETSLV